MIFWVSMYILVGMTCGGMYVMGDPSNNCTEAELDRWGINVLRITFIWPILAGVSFFLAVVFYLSALLRGPAYLIDRWTYWRIKRHMVAAWKKNQEKT